MMMKIELARFQGKKTSSRARKEKKREGRRGSGYGLRVQPSAMCDALPYLRFAR